ncbi:MAG: hypothetical protein KAX18_03285 [Candidatus Lokiarchaeota archaeon]|nr:hypothetical protein [Candidatus Lokiarchaeota archaeon]
MTNEQIKKLESRLNEIERKINERLERMADDDLIEESARDLIDELDKIRKDFLKLITIPSKICEYVDPPEDNQRIVDNILQIERLYDVLGLESVTHLSTIKDYLFPPVVLNWETRWSVSIEGLKCRFHVVAKDVPLELDQFPPQDNIVTLKSIKTIEFEFIDADFHVDGPFDPASARLFDVTPEKKFALEL